MTAPTYDDACTPSTVAAVEADLLSRIDPTSVAGWAASAPQRQLVSSEAVALQFEQLQRAILARTASPAKLKQLRSWLVTQGYGAADAATLASAWVDLGLARDRVTRIAAVKAVWTVPLTGSGTVDNKSSIVLQADDGTLFVSAQASAVTLPADVTFEARTAGISGNVIAGTISTVVSGPAGVAIGNGTQSLVTSGRDAETDEAAIQRADDRWGTRSYVLTAAGWRYVIQTPEVGGVATLTRVFVDDANPDGPCSVRITVANASGAPTVAELAAAQAQGAALKIAGMGRVTISAASVTDVAISAVLKTDGSNALAATQGATALTQLAGALTGDWLYVDAVIAVLMGIAGVVNLQSLSLSADVPRPSTGILTIAPTITQV